MKTIIHSLLLVFLIACSKPEVKKEALNNQKEIPQYSIEQFYKNNRVSGGSFNNEETKLVISSDESGIFNIFEIDIITGQKKQLTFSEKESFFAIDKIPNSDKLIYTADKGGDENNHIYLLNKEGNSTDLTPGDKVKVSFKHWSEDKKSMFYLSNKRDQKYFDLYKMNLNNWKSKMVYKNDKGLNIDDVSHNELIFSISKSITKSEDKLFLLDNKNNKTTEISDEPGSYNGSGFSNDDKYFYYITDVGKEFKYLVKYEIATGKKETVFETNWDVMYSYLSKSEKYRVIGVNEDGKTNLIIKSNASDKNIVFPEIPDGDIKGVNISESEKLMRLTVGTSKSTNNIYLYNFETKELKQLTNTMSDELDSNNLVSAKVVRFKSFDGLEIPAIYYKPLMASEENKAPALVWVHGGPGGQSRVGYFSLIQFLVNHGYAILAVNNRGSSGYGKTFYKMDDLNHGDKDLQDCIWGKKWLQEQNYIDVNKIGIIGGSYGGYMTMAAMAFTPDEFKTGVNIFGVTNWLRTLKSIPPHWESFKQALYTELGDPNTQDSVRLYNISPLFHADKIKNPVMVLQGANDPRVLQVESDEMVAEMRKNNIPVEYVLFPDEGHGFRKKENEIKGYGQILEFLDKYLKEVEPIKS
ncbi:MAG: S9 family peptidase [Flavobacteriaceae bacterium]|nr:S9 family peptidase [Flavobacteriaceae bacterium]